MEVSSVSIRSYRWSYQLFRRSYQLFKRSYQNVRRSFKDLQTIVFAIVSDNNLILHAMNDCTFVPCADCGCRHSCAGESTAQSKHLLASHRSACKTSCQTILGTTNSMPKYAVHKTAAVNGFLWLPWDNHNGMKVPYCMKKVRPPWATASPAAAKSTLEGLGCRRKHGTEVGMCNAGLQSKCQRSINCICGLAEGWTRADLDEQLEQSLTWSKTERSEKRSETKVLQQWWGAICTCETSELAYRPIEQGNNPMNPRLAQVISIRYQRRTAQFIRRSSQVSQTIVPRP